MHSHFLHSGHPEPGRGSHRNRLDRGRLDHFTVCLKHRVRPVLDDRNGYAPPPDDKHLQVLLVRPDDSDSCADGVVRRAVRPKRGPVPSLPRDLHHDVVVCSVSDGGLCGNWCPSRGARGSRGCPDASRRDDRVERLSDVSPRAG
uniref:(northern house mosquito) hypothetical protein n=1 Tax=Culex pipiens TaxID=7175 RepID=A0A8D8E6C1_CULPI